MQKSQASSYAERARFNSTCWSLVFRAPKRADPDQIRAMEELCQIYWFPVLMLTNTLVHIQQKFRTD
jgi:hypothetical protein